MRRLVVSDTTQRGGWRPDRESQALRGVQQAEGEKGEATAASGLSPKGLDCGGALLPRFAPSEVCCCVAHGCPVRAEKAAQKCADSLGEQARLLGASRAN